MKIDRWSDGSSELNGDQRLNRFGATQFAAELRSNSDLTRVQSWTTLVQRALNVRCRAIVWKASQLAWRRLELMPWFACLLAQC